MVLKEVIDNYTKSVTELVGLKTGYAIHLLLFTENPNHEKIDRILRENQVILRRAKKNLTELRDLAKRREEWRKALGKV